MDLNFDTLFFDDIFLGRTVINIVTKGKLLLIFYFSTTKKKLDGYSNALIWYVPILFIKQKSVDVRDS